MNPKMRCQFPFLKIDNVFGNVKNRDFRRERGDDRYIYMKYRFALDRVNNKGICKLTPTFELGIYRRNAAFDEWEYPFDSNTATGDNTYVFTI